MISDNTNDFSYFKKFEQEKLLDVKFNQERIMFLFESGQIYMVAVGDCCSHSWIENVELPARMRDMTFGKVLEIRDDNLVDSFDIDDGLRQLYGKTFVTEAGHITVDFRNDSNGYYGGRLEYEQDTGASNLLLHEAILNLSQTAK